MIRFSEPMDTESGMVSVEPGGELPRARWSWAFSGSVLTITPNSPWSQGEVVVTVSGFVDVGGTAMEEAYQFSFSGIDDEAPSVVATSPAEGATDVTARIDSIDITFDEPMDTRFGRLDVLGGSATLGEAEWSADATMVSFAASGLEYERTYEVTLTGFRDEASNLLNGEPVLGDGILDFATGPDVDAPRVVMSIPMEGQVDVNAAIANEIFITFDEAMDPTITSFEFSNGTETRTLTGRWTEGQTVLRVVIAGLIEYDTMYSLDISNTRDRAGNLVDPTFYLNDGSLDFTASDDVFDPIVVMSSPVEGTVGVAQREPIEISVTFSEAMDQSITMTTLSSPTGAPISVAGSWRTPTNIVFFIPAGRLSARTTYGLDLTPFEDLSGRPTDASHRYLRDGVLDFTTGAPLGEACGDVLTVADATPEDGALRWSIGSGTVATRDGGTDACADYSGTARRPDAVVAYEKVSGDVASGGRLLKVTAVGGSTSTRFDIAVTPGVCDPAAMPARCTADSEIHEVYADIPAGPVHIWVSPNSSSTFSTNVVLTVEEVAAPRPEGEACDNPYTTASSIFSTSAGVDTFAIPNGPMGPRARDISAYSRDDLISCDPTSTTSTSAINGTGVDAVIRYTVPADAILRVTAEGFASSLISEFNITAFEGCDVTPSSTELGCIGNVSTTAKEGIIDAPPGDIFLWVTNNDTDVYRSSSSGDNFFQDARIRIERIPVSDGDTCSRGLPASVGSNSVVGGSTLQVNRPSCFPSTSDVEWYRITSSGGRLVANTNAGGVALYNGSTQLSCSDDGSTTPVEAFIASGTEVCVAVQMGAGASSFDLAETPYTGVGVNPPVDLPIERPVDDSGNLDVITGETWMGGNADHLVLGYNPDGEMLESLKDGMGPSIYRGADDGLSPTNTGYVGVTAANGSVFTFENTLSATGNRVFRVWDGSSSLWSPVAWDVPAPTYPTELIAAANVVGDTIYFVTADDFPVFYSMSAAAPGAPVRLGTNEIVTDVTGLAVDDTYVYVAGELKATSVEGVFRIPLAQLGDPTAIPVDLAPGIDHDGAALPFGPVNMFVDATTAPTYLYIRNAAGHVEAIGNPAGSADYIGEVITVGTSSDTSMWLDPVTGSLYLFETDTDLDGNILRFDP